MRSAAAAVLLVVALAAPLLPPTAATAGAPPTLAGWAWLPREGTAEEPVLALRLMVDAPAGLAGGAASVAGYYRAYEEEAAIGPLAPGSHDVELRIPFSATPWSTPYAWELTTVRLAGADGARAEYGLCDLLAMAPVHEPDVRQVIQRRMIDTWCLEAPGWVVLTLRGVHEGAWASMYVGGVYTHRGQSIGYGHVLQDAEGETLTWGTGIGVTPGDYEDDEILVRHEGDTIVAHEEPPENRARRVNYGIGTNQRAVAPGETVRWGIFHTFKDPRIDYPVISAFGEGVEVLAVEEGGSAWHFDTSDFDLDVKVRSPTLGATAFARGSVHATTATSTSGFFQVVGFTNLAVAFTTVEGPEGSLYPRAFHAATPGTYAFRLDLSLYGVAWSEVIVTLADMPLRATPGTLV